MYTLAYTFLSEAVTWLEDFIFQLGNDIRHEIGVGIREEGHRGDERPTVVVDDVLSQFLRELAKDTILVEELALVPVLEVLRYPLTHLPWKLSVRHVFFNLFHLKKKGKF